jgi:hypothetical protein
MCRPFDAETIHDAASAIGRLRSLPYGPIPSSIGAFFNERGPWLIRTFGAKAP